MVGIVSAKLNAQAALDAAVLILVYWFLTKKHTNYTKWEVGDSWNSSLR